MEDAFSLVMSFEPLDQAIPEVWAIFGFFHCVSQ